MRLYVRCWIIAASFAVNVEHSTSFHLQTNPWIWIVGNTGVECSRLCEAVGMMCSEIGMRSVQNPESVYAMSLNTQYPCNISLPMTPSQFPSITEHGQCTYTWLPLANGMNDCNTCNATPWVFLRRHCPCSEQADPTTIDCPTQRSTPPSDPDSQSTTPPNPDRHVTTTTKDPSSVGDPHITNIKGETFDVLREGSMTFLRFPAEIVEKKDTRLRVNAQIKRAGTGTRCNSFYVVGLKMSGTLIGEDITISTHGWDLDGEMELVVQIGNQTMDTAKEIAAFTPETNYSITINDRRSQMHSEYLHHRVKFAHLKLELAGAALEIQWSTGGRRPNALDFRASHLINLGTTWGGLLGNDDHSWVSKSTTKCKELFHGNKQGLLIKKGAAPSFMTASLD